MRHVLKFLPSLSTLELVRILQCREFNNNLSSTSIILTDRLVVYLGLSNFQCLQENSFEASILVTALLKWKLYLSNLCSNRT
ncbi:hypothetical protein LENED_001408 [Lentinula edodes]|uniref:Uncharacterized protein n=1 Tax=Lentinula edodes TaxID=5353 RepID=A0A1Q3DY34_LENED|nr:hypothetical protein LENED_001408 [Lentinula edodes]